MTDENKDIKRLNYFKGQFLEAQDFQAEQSYHIEMRRQLNKLLYSPGAVNGFEITISQDKKQITVAPGFAIDAQGRELLILAPQTSENTTVFLANAAVYVTLRYKDEQLDSDKRTTKQTEGIDTFTGCIRITERPEINFSTELPKGLDVGIAIPVAKLQLDADRNIQSVDTSVRQLANGIVGGNLQLDGNQQIKFTDSNTSNNLKLQLWRGFGLGINPDTLFYAAYGKHSWRDYEGTNERMRLTTTADGGLAVLGTGDSSFAGNLGIGTTEPNSTLSIAGGLSVGTTYAKKSVNKKAAPANSLLIEGNVGIGTDDPKSTLSVNGGVAIGSIYAQFVSAPTNGMLVEGKVGIGPQIVGGTLGDGPSALLHISSPTEATNTVNTELISRWTRPRKGGVKFGNTFDILLGSYETSLINSQTRVDFMLADGPDEKPDRTVMTLQGNGNLGIGTTEPNSTLSIAGGLSVGTNYAKKSAGKKAAPANDLLVEGNVGIGTDDPKEKLEISDGKLQIDGDQQIKFTEKNVTDNLKLQLWGGCGLGINQDTLFYAANGKHSWRDKDGKNERMRLSTAAEGGLEVLGGGDSSFAGKLGIGTTTPGARLEVAGALTATQNNEALVGLKIAPAFQDSDKTKVKHYGLIVAEGNVGIGMTSSNAKLEVAGDVYVSSGSIYGKINHGEFSLSSNSIINVSDKWTLTVKMWPSKTSVAFFTYINMKWFSDFIRFIDNIEIVDRDGYWCLDCAFNKSTGRPDASFNQIIAKARCIGGVPAS